jgi:hypothetical protein
VRDHPAAGEKPVIWAGSLQDARIDYEERYGKGAT